MKITTELNQLIVLCFFLHNLCNDPNYIEINKAKMQKGLPSKDTIIQSSKKQRMATANRVHDQIDRPEGRNQIFSQTLNCQS